MKNLLEIRDKLMDLRKGRSVKYMYTLDRIKHKYSFLKNHECNALCFLTIDHVVQLSVLSGYDLVTIEKIINNPRYQEFKIVKKKGGYRTIAAPNPILKKVQNILNYYLQACYLTMKPECSYGFVINPNDVENKHNIVKNASHHVGKKEILNIDIQDFFPNISATKVYQLLKSEPFNFPEHLCASITLICTYKKQLPTGAPTSPVLSNLICIPLDNDLQNLSNKFGYTYTRYADDLSFSSENVIEQSFESAVYEILEKHGFKSQTKKRRLQKYYQHQNVTGIIVNEKLNVKREKLKKVRAMLHDAKTNGLAKASRNHYGKLTYHNENNLIWNFIQKLRAEISYIKYVRGEDELYKKIEQEFNLLLHAY